MIPLRDNIRSGTTPYVTYTIVAVCTVVHVAQYVSRYLSGNFLMGWAVVPHNLISPAAWAEVGPLHVFGSLIGSQFLHGDPLHLGFNMLFLWVFGDNVEDRLGHGRFAVFYLTCGVIAALAQSLLSWFPDVPMIGASGAIAGVLGAYFVMFKTSWIRSVVILFIFPIFIDIPALVFLGLWFVLQTVNTLYSVGPSRAPGDPGVAFAAHVAGFVAGILLLRVFHPRKPAEPRPRVVRFHVDE